MSELSGLDMGGFTVDRFYLKKSTLTREGRYTKTWQTSLSEIREAVLERVKPSLREEETAGCLGLPLLCRIENLARERGLEIRAMLVGSAARGTWLAGDHDLDIFLGLDEEADLEAALELARSCLPIVGRNMPSTLMSRPG